MIEKLKKHYHAVVEKLKEKYLPKKTLTYTKTENVITVDFRKEHRNRQLLKKKEKLEFYWKFKHESITMAGILVLLFFFVALLIASSCFPQYHAPYYDTRIHQP